MINDDDRGRDRQSSDYSQPSKRKRITTGNKPYEKVDYNRRSDESQEKKPLYSSDKSSNRPPSRDDTRSYPRENFRRNPDGNRDSGYERRDRDDRSSGYERNGNTYDRGNSGYNRPDSGNSYDRRSSGYDRPDSGNSYERRSSGYDRPNSGNGSGYDRGSGRPFERRSSGSGSDQRPGFKKSYSKDGKPDFQSQRGRSSGKPFQKNNFVRPVQPPQRQPIYRTEDLPQDVPVRLNKLIANTGLCSRREADTYIKTGLISVNGNLITELGSKVLPTDEIRYNGERLSAEKKVYILLNKPKDYVTSVDDPHAKRTVMELLRGACRERIYPVGRLDRMTTGVLLLTNDGELTKKLTHPTSNIRKIYQAHLDKNLKVEDMHAISEGITLDDGFIRLDGISYTSDDDKSLVGVEIHSGRNRIVRRVFEHLGYKVTKLDRVYFAGLTKKALQRGTWRYLDPKEVGFLKMMKA